MQDQRHERKASVKQRARERASTTSGADQLRRTNVSQLWMFLIHINKNRNRNKNKKYFFLWMFLIYINKTETETETKQKSNNSFLFCMKKKLNAKCAELHQSFFIYCVEWICACFVWCMIVNKKKLRFFFGSLR